MLLLPCPALSRKKKHSRKHGLIGNLHMFGTIKSYPYFFKPGFGYLLYYKTMYPQLFLLFCRHFGRYPLGYLMKLSWSNISEGYQTLAKWCLYLKGILWVWSWCCVNCGLGTSPTWWLIPLSKWVITPVINGISRVNPLITGVITRLLSGMNHQVWDKHRQATYRCQGRLPARRPCGCDLGCDAEVHRSGDVFCLGWMGAKNPWEKGWKNADFHWFG